jgi:hypothetical protein
MQGLGLFVFNVGRLAGVMNACLCLSSSLCILLILTSHEMSGLDDCGSNSAHVFAPRKFLFKNCNDTADESVMHAGAVLFGKSRRFFI